MGKVKRILIVTASFYPDNTPRAFRATELAKEFARQGFSVTVLTFPNSEHDELQSNFGIKFVSLGHRRWPEVALFGKGFFSLIRRVLRRSLKMLLEYPNLELMFLVRKALSHVGFHDVLISLAAPYPVHWGVAAARNKKRSLASVWIADCGDPFMGQENDSFKYPIYFMPVEKWFCRKADFIVVPTQGAIHGYYKEFHSKIRVIPQGLKFEDVELAEPPESKDLPEFAYAGIFIPGRRDPRELLAFLISLKMEFRFHLYTRSEDLVKEYVDSSNGRIILHSPVPRADLLYELSKLHFVVNIDNRGHRQVPSKLVDYTVINRPILSVRTGDLDRENVLRFLKGDYSGRLVIENPDQYRIENVCRKFLELVREKKS